VYPVPTELKKTLQMFQLRTEICYSQIELNRKLGKPGRKKKNDIKMNLSKVDPEQCTDEWSFLCVCVKCNENQIK
jgi:hypothetical protein